MDLNNNKATKCLLLKYAIGTSQVGEIIDWACSLLCSSIDSKHLRCIAGYTPTEAESELEQFRNDFEQALKELNIQTPPKKEAYSDYACFICESYLDEAISSEHANSILYNIWEVTNLSPKDKIDNRFDIWMYLTDSRDLIAEGYGPLLENLRGLNESNYETFFKNEVIHFLRNYKQNH